MFHEPTRRQILQVLSATGLALFLPGLRVAAQPAAIQRHPRRGDPDWPTETDWQQLKARVQGRLIEPAPVGATAENARNPFFLEDQAGGTQSRGWLKAWDSTPSAYAVAAESAQDVAAAVDFARQHRLRIVVKGTGHDYLGRSCGPDSLLVWTHRMRAVESHDRFIPQRAPASVEGVPALSVSAGTRWLEAYGEATTNQGRYVQGGGCASVGACGGFILGGGFGSFSKKFGSGAAGLLEAELVTWDGRIVVANSYRHPELYWALRGGGGATFGIVTRMTLLTHPLPETFGALTGTLKATSDLAFRVLIERFCEFYCQALNNEHWGEQFALLPDNSLTLALTFQGLDKERVATIWSPLLNWLAQHPEDYQVDTDVVVVPARHMWDLAYWKAHHPQLVQPDPRPGADPGTFWWIGNGAEVSMYWYTYQSRWIPLTAFQSRDFAATLFEASRHWRVSMHGNKGLAGASSEALGRCRQTAVNPVVYEAAALVILGAGTQLSQPNPVEGAEQLGRVNAAMKILRDATPNSGSYANEADYFEPDWQREFWGVHYAKLLEVKRRYDPIGLFHCHHGVGSEGWSADGMSRA